MRPLAVTPGEPAGIGVEIIKKAWQKCRHEEHLAFFVLGLPAHIAQQADDVKLKTIERAQEAREIFAKALPVLDISTLSDKPLDFECPGPGHPLPSNGGYVIETIREASLLALKGEVDAIITAPIHKKILAQAGFAFPGHTEFLADMAARHQQKKELRTVMMLKGPSLTVVPVTIHQSLKEVAGSLNEALICDTARVVSASLARFFDYKKPALGICGLNPHAGEGGLFGEEEQTIIRPAIERLQREGIIVDGPFSPDSIFARHLRGKFDAILAMYHDQALIPVKTLDFDRAVNITLNLPFIRTSPDHGTGFDIAGRGEASPDSMVSALEMARTMGENRDKR